MAEPKVQVEELIRKIERMFPMPQTLVKIMDVMNNPDANVARLEDVLKADPNFSLRLLGMANSAYYGSLNEITNVRSAITLLGFSAIKNLALQTTINQCFRIKHANPYFSSETLWKHSVGVAVCTKMLARRLKLGNSEDFFTMGILHDIGLLIESQFYTDALIGIFTRMAGESKPLPDLERDTFGLTHGQVTHLLCEKWRLPLSLSLALKYHHAPEEAPPEHQKNASAVYLADKIVMRAEYGFVYPRGEEQEAAILSGFNLETVDRDVLLEDFQAEADQFLHLLQEN